MKKILIIEDERDFVTAIKTLLEAEGFNVSTAPDGAQGLADARKNKYDLIIMDIMMPKMDGYKVCGLLKFDKKYRHIPIIMLTARAQEQDRLIGEQCGADAYMLKTQNPDILISKVKELINK